MAATTRSIRSSEEGRHKFAFLAAGIVVAILVSGCASKNLTPPAEVDVQQRVPEASSPQDADPATENSHYVLAKPRYADETATVPATGAAALTSEHPDLAPKFLGNAVLADVNGEIITREDILGPIRAELARWRKESTPEAFEDHLRAVVEFRLSRVVSQRLLVQEAKARLSTQEQEDLLATVTAAGLDAADLAGVETVSGTLAGSVDEPALAPADWVLVQALLRETVGPQVHVTQAELLKHYKEVVAERYVLPTKVRPAVILIRKCDSATPQWAESLAKAVHSRAAKGEDFAKLQQRYGYRADEAVGDDGFIARGGYPVKAVEDVLFDLPIGAVGPLVETAEAFYIVKSLGRQEGRTIPLAEVQSALEQELRDRKFRARAAGYVQELYERWRTQVALVKP
jgi:hypothetical protein